MCKVSTRYVLCMIGLIFPWLLQAQDSIYTLAPSEIVAEKIRFQTQYSQTRFVKDSLYGFGVSGLSVDAVLRQASGLNIRNYGGHGGIKTISVRGFAANLTTVTIADIPYQQAQSGVVNFGLFSVNAFDIITLERAASSNVHNPLGGNVNFESVLKGKKNYTSIGAGSFGETLIKIGTQREGKRLGYMLNVVGLRAKDNYTYKYNGDTFTREHAQMQSLQFQGKYQYALHKYWNSEYFFMGNVGRQQVPSAIVTGNAGLASDSLTQSDFFHFLKIAYTPLLQKQKWTPTKTTFALSHHYNYLQSLNNQRWNNYKNQDILAQIQAMYVFSNQILHNTINWNLQNLNGNNLAIQFQPIAEVSRTQWSFASTHQAFWGQKAEKSMQFRTQSSARINIVKPYGVLFNGSLGGYWRPFRQKGFEFYTHLQSGKRLPAFNELYYFGFGNSTLLPENITSFDVGYTSKKYFSDLNLTYGFSGFINETRNKIISIPLTPAIWSTQSIGLAKTMGFSWDIEAILYKKHRIYANYTLQKANSIENGVKKILPYTPLEVCNYGYLMNLNKFQLYINGSYSGWRFSLLENDKNSFLPAYNIVDIGCSYHFIASKFRYNFVFDVENIANTSYQIVKSYPMPGRSFRITANFYY